MSEQYRPLSDDQIIDLLKVASAYDHRKPNSDTVIAWRESSRRGRWTFAAALNAIHDHHNDSAERIMPVHISQRIRRDRSQPAPVGEVLALCSGAPASELTRRRVMEMLAEKYTPETPQQKAARIHAEWEAERAA